ncbi:hypothetical protein [Klebsiella pneumoniae]
MTPEEKENAPPRPGSSLRRRDNQSDERGAEPEAGRCMPHPILRRHYEKVKPMGVSLVIFVSVSSAAPNGGMERKS